MPSLQLGLGNNAAQYYCQSQVTTSLAKGQTRNGYTQFTVPLSTFNCDLTRWDCCVCCHLTAKSCCSGYYSYLLRCAASLTALPAAS